MKRSFLTVALLLLLILPLTVLASEEKSVSLDSVRIAEDGKTLTVDYTVSQGFAALYPDLFLFQVLPNYDGVLTGLTPIDEASLSSGGRFSFTVPYQKDNAFSALYGYLLARQDDKGIYCAVSDPVYAENFTDFAAYRAPYTLPKEIKGLQVQLYTDAQTIGVKHSTVPMYFNEFISEDEDTALPFLYGGNRYYIDKTALASLDYRVKTLSSAGIHVYMNCLLAFDPTAPSALYYPKASGSSSSLYLPNVSTPTGVEQYAAVLHFLAERYGDVTSDRGFCGSFILGYEVNMQQASSSAGILKFDDYLHAYASFLRTADRAVRSAYSEARVFISLSNTWVPEDASDVADGQYFGAHLFLEGLLDTCGDLPFGISINPYPSALSLTEYWTDEKATDSLDTPYLTMKNLSVLTDYLGKEEALYQGRRRAITVGEFGISGRLDEESEKMQAAAYLCAYYTVLNNKHIESFIYHRHVDHAAEKDLYFGLYASSDLLLDPTVSKELYHVFSKIDLSDPKERSSLSLYLALLPVDLKADIVLDDATQPLRSTLSLDLNKDALSSLLYRDHLLFDFSQGLYHFYPSDNAQYIELRRGDNETYLRAKLLRVSSIEYMGVSSLVSLASFQDADYLTVRLRVLSSSPSAEVMVRLTGTKSGRSLLLSGVTTVTSKEWQEVILPIDNLASLSSEEVTLKIWTRAESSSGSELYLDIASISLHTENDRQPLLFTFIAVVGCALILGVFFIVYFLLLHKRRKQRAVSSGA